MLRSAGQQDYNAMQLAFTRRSRGGLTFAANYTLAKGMSDVTQPGGGGAQQAYGVDPNRIHELEWSPSDIDIRHRYAFSLNYQLPFGRDATGARPLPRRRLAGQPAGLLAERRAVHRVQRHARAATPAPARIAPTRPAPACSTIRPSTSGSTRRASSARTSTPSATPAATTSTVRRSGALDLSLFKDIVIGTQRLQLRLEVFNVTNTPSFAVPDGGLGSATFGRITSTGNNIPRQFQFAAKYLF